MKDAVGGRGATSVVPVATTVIVAVTGIDSDYVATEVPLLSTAAVFVSATFI